MVHYIAHDGLTPYVDKPNLQQSSALASLLRLQSVPLFWVHGDQILCVMVPKAGYLLYFFSCFIYPVIGDLVNYNLGLLQLGKITQLKGGSCMCCDVILDGIIVNLFSLSETF